MKKTKISKTALPLSYDQFIYILDEFIDQKNIKMALICHLLFRCVRIRDILRVLKVKDIYGYQGEIRDKIRYIESKNGKTRIIPIAGARFIKALRLHYLEAKLYKRTDNLFIGSKSKSVLREGSIRNILLKFKGKRGIEQCSPYSLRKCGARFMFDNGVRLENIQNMMNHSHPRITERYICIVPEDIEESMEVLAV